MADVTSKYLKTGIHVEHTKIVQKHFLSETKLPDTNFPIYSPGMKGWSEFEWGSKSIGVDGEPTKDPNYA